MDVGGAVSAPRDIAAAEEHVARGSGWCDACGHLWTAGAYCPGCDVFALDSHLGRCPDCGRDTEYSRRHGWRHVDPEAPGCFLIPAGYGHGGAPWQ